MIETKLVIQISSFSYRKGIPADDSENGGGYVFDCRGILNPGRIEEYKTQTGRDQGVKDYLENNTSIKDFLQNVFGLLDITVPMYLDRGFDHLQVSFGCTGGQHRSVYSADATVKYLQEKYNVQIELRHVEQEAKNWINKPY